jgi:hypothetical protein
MQAHGLGKGRIVLQRFLSAARVIVQHPELVVVVSRTAIFAKRLARMVE